MESMSSSSNQVIQPPTTTSSSDHSRRKRKKKSSPSQNQSQSQSKSLQTWRSEKQQQIYSTKLVRALKELRISRPSTSSSSQSSIPKNGRAVREVADRALAVAAKGRTRWSRAILSKAVKIKFRKQKRQRISNSPALTTSTTITGINRSYKQRTNIIKLKSKGLPAVQRKVKVLSRLVPGCRKQTLPVVLEETTDYIAAMEMQIRAMTAILSAVNSNAGISNAVNSNAVSPPSPPPSGQEGEQTHMFG